MAQATCESLKEALDREKESLANALKQCDLLIERCLVLTEENDMVRLCVCVCACVCVCVCVCVLTVYFVQSLSYVSYDTCYGHNPPARLWHTIQTHVHAHTHTHKRTHTHTHTYTHARTHSHIHARTHTYKHTNTRSQIHTHTQTHTQHTNTCVNKYICTRTHAHSQKCS